MSQEFNIEIISPDGKIFNGKCSEAILPCFEGQVTILKDISINIPKGSKVGIIGPSGSGKSTIIDIICGFKKAKKNSIKVDGKCVLDNIEEWRTNIGYIPQDIVILNQSIKENILFGFSNIKYSKFPRVSFSSNKDNIKNIFDIDTETVNSIYDSAKIGMEGEVPSIEDLNRALIDENLEPVQFCKKDGLKIIPEKLRANSAKTPNNKKKITTKKTKATANKESSSFSESFQTIITYGGGGLIGVFIIRAAKEILSN